MVRLTQQFYLSYIVLKEKILYEPKFADLSKALNKVKSQAKKKAKVIGSVKTLEKDKKTRH